MICNDCSPCTPVYLELVIGLHSMDNIGCDSIIHIHILFGIYFFEIYFYIPITETNKCKCAQCFMFFFPCYICYSCLKTTTENCLLASNFCLRYLTKISIYLVWPSPKINIFSRFIFMVIIWYKIKHFNNTET